MRLLTFLGVLQTGCLLLIVFLLIDGRQNASTPLPFPPGVVVPESNVGNGASALGADEVRRIIREELEAQARIEANQPRLQTPPRNPVEDQLRRERVGRQLDYYRRVGRITASQMDELQDEIAQLDVPSRKAMLSRLVRSMNLGEIDGRL